MLFYMITVCLISFAFNMHFIWTANIIDLVCYAFPITHPQRSTLLNVLGIISNAFLPYPIIMASNIAIISNLKSKKRAQLKKLCLKSKKIEVSDAITNRFILHSFIFIFSFFPLRILNLIIVINPKFTSKSYVFLCVQKIFVLLIYTFFSLNFLIHFFTSNYIRTRLMNLLQSKSRQISKTSNECANNEEIYLI